MRCPLFGVAAGSFGDANQRVASEEAIALQFGMTTQTPF
jgi:hypothetical protein